MMKNLLISLMFCGLLVGCGNKTVKTPEQLKSELQKEIPGLPADMIINKSPLSGVYEVVVGRKVFYVTDDGKHLLFGNLIAVADKKNLTEQRITELSKINWTELPLNLAITKVYGSGKNKLAIFSDPDCPYCQMFEKQIAPQLKDTTVYTFLFPLPNHPTAKTHSQQIWCSKDRSLALTSWMVDKKMISGNTSCDTSGIDQIIKAGIDIVQVDATPTIILENGQILQGMVPAEQLVSMMEQAASKSVVNKPQSPKK